MQAISVGPWVVSVGVLALLLGTVAAHSVARWMRRRGYVDVGNALWWLLVAALLAARGAYVVRWWSAYAHSPWWSVFDVRDAGFDSFAGVVVLLLATAGLAWRRKVWRRVLPAAVMGGVVAWAGISLAARRLDAAAHPPLPALTLQTLDGASVSIASLRGKPLVINLWATWCGPCRREMPMLMDAAQTLPNVRFVFADQGENPAQVRAYLKTQNLPATHVLLDANRDLARYYHTIGYPTTLFIGADGHLRDMRVGALSRATLQQHLSFVSPSP